MRQAPTLVCSPPVTLLAGLVQTDGIAVFADRASIDPYRDIAPGVPAPGAPRTKVFASAAAGVVAGIAGTVSVPGVDLLKAVQQVVARTTAAGVHTQLLVALAAAAPILREHRALPTQVTPFEQPVMTVVLLGTATPAHRHAQLTAYGIPDTGAPVFTSMQRSVVFAPVTVQPDAELMMLTDEAAHAGTAAAIAAWGARLPELSTASIVRQHVDISHEWDAAAVSPTGTVSHFTSRSVQGQLSIERH